MISYYFTLCVTQSPSLLCYSMNTLTIDYYIRYICYIVFHDFDTSYKRTDERMLERILIARYKILHFLGFSEYTCVMHFYLIIAGGLHKHCF